METMERKVSDTELMEAAIEKGVDVFIYTGGRVKLMEGMEKKWFDSNAAALRYINSL